MRMVIIDNVTQAGFSSSNNYDDDDSEIDGNRNVMLSQTMMMMMIVVSDKQGGERRGKERSNHIHLPPFQADGKFHHSYFIVLFGKYCASQ